MGEYRFRWLPRHDARITELYHQIDPTLSLDDIAADIGVGRDAVVRRLAKLGVSRRSPQFMPRSASPLGMSHRGCTVVRLVPHALGRNRKVVLRCDANPKHEFEKFLSSVRDETASGCPWCRVAKTFARRDEAIKRRELTVKAVATLPSPRKRMFEAVKKLGPNQVDTYLLYRRKGFSAREALSAAEAVR